jgi:hypothetical protein
MTYRKCSIILIYGHSKRVAWRGEVPPMSDAQRPPLSTHEPTLNEGTVCE